MQPIDRCLRESAVAIQHVTQHDDDYVRFQDVFNELAVSECFGDGTDACKTNGVCSGGEQSLSLLPKQLIHL
jgi:hypothetical protein